MTEKTRDRLILAVVALLLAGCIVWFLTVPGLDMTAGQRVWFLLKVVMTLIKMVI